MDMIACAAYPDCATEFIVYDCSHEGVEFAAPSLRDCSATLGGRENHMDVDAGTRMSHVYAAPAGVEYWLCVLPTGKPVG
jgi:hypothetical protein